MKIFSRKNIDQVVDATISAGDKLFFTNEEKADYSKGIADAQIEYLKSTIGESSIRSLTRRWLSMAIMFVFLFLILFSVAVRWWDPEYARFVFSVAREMLTLVMMVAGFFFGGYMVKNYVAPAFNKGKK